MTHYYVVDTSVVLEGAAVSELQFNIIQEEPFVVHDLKLGLKDTEGLDVQLSYDGLRVPVNL
ncbi:Sterigmatocystin biosynthesis fatty acid synthase subunit alpha [Bienertia sinuspersici]